MHKNNFQVWQVVAAYLILKFWNCGKIWPSTFKWTHTCQKIWKFNFKTVWPLIWPFWPLLALLKFFLDSEGLRSLVPCSNHENGHSIIKNSYHWKFPILNQCDLFQWYVWYSVNSEAMIFTIPFIIQNDLWQNCKFYESVFKWGLNSVSFSWQ